MRTHTPTVLLTAILASAATAQVGEGERAPAFPFKESTSPSVANFKDLRGKVLMLDFFTTT